MEDSDENEKIREEPKDRKARMRAEFDSLHTEMELAEFATDKLGINYRRKLPRKVSLVRTKKRKQLEKVDRERHAISVVDDTREDAKRLRGSRAALEDEVLHGSFIFGDRRTSDNATEDVDDDINEGGFVEEGADDEENIDIEEVDDEDEPNDIEEDVEEYIEGDGDVVNEQPEDNGALVVAQHEELEVPVTLAGAATQTGKSQQNSTGKKKTRIMHRLRDFKSFRMAQRHGDALGAHARGLPKVAIERLKELADDAPTAPQVYSSLGMVYESMLKQSREHQEGTVAFAGLDEEEDDGIAIDDALTEATLSKAEKEGNDDSKKNMIFKQINLAKKAYGSYHAAALLCKKDFTLWVRAADTAMETAELYTQVMEFQDLPESKREEYRVQKARWIEDAMRDYTGADNLRPPGIDIPAKLARAHMELGNLSEALTILTDLKNRKNSDINRSFRMWLLYSELMLRIGHECSQWNKGIQTNDNYMFRRWLRKCSKTFDWQERRLQALCLALEAAAGSKSCFNLIRWTKKRARDHQRNDSSLEAGVALNDRWNVNLNPTSDNGPVEQKSKNNASQGDGKIDSETNELHESNSANENRFDENQESLSSLTAAFEAQRQLLTCENRSNLEAFDKETESMNLDPNGDETLKRQSDRINLVKQQKASVVHLAGDFHQRRMVFEKSKDSENGEAQRMEKEDQNEDTLPISASCAVVCNIASELMKHSLELQLYEGGALVGEAASAYFKERAALSERKLASRNAFDKKQQSTDESVLLGFEPYDEIAEEAAESDGDESVALYFSDDGDIDDRMDVSLFESLKRGSLPPQLRVLYAIALIGQGGRNYVVSKCIEDIHNLESEDPSLLNEAPVDTNITRDREWQVFRRKRTDKLQRTAAFALVADIVQKTGKEHEWNSRLAGLFLNQIEYMEEQGVMDELSRDDTSHSLYSRWKKREVVKIILAASRMKSLALDDELSNILPDSSSEQVVETMKHAFSFLSFVSKYCYWLWDVEDDASISPSNIEVLGTCSRALEALRLGATATGQSDDDIFRKDLSFNLKQIISVLCGVEIPDLESHSPEGVSSVSSWTELPIPSDWQTLWQQAVSTRVHNLCIACNASLFSGWEADEFNLDLLQYRPNHKYLGIHIGDKHIGGYASEEIEQELTRQWEHLGNFLPLFSSVDITEGLVEVKTSHEWYTNAMQKLTTESCHENVSIYGEEDGLKILLALSNFCLLAAESSPDEKSKDALCRTALSVLLPLSQLCLDRQLWESPLGTNATGTRSGRSRMVNWRQYSDKRPSRRDGKRNRTPKEKTLSPPPGFFKNRKKAKPVYSDYVAIPASFLKFAWQVGGATTAIEENHLSSSSSPHHHETSSKNSAAQEAMERLDNALHHLRGCFTIAATQKGSLEVAVAMLELVELGACNNPFLCLQQAAIFASHGSKRGNSDEYFKKPLPANESDWTPTEALLILGRADCYQALHFPNEAMFLCSEVARACSLRRNNIVNDPDLLWTDQWRIVGIMTYNVSVAITKTTESPTLKFNGKKISLDSWEKATIEAELENGKADAIAMACLLPGNNTIVEDEAADEKDNDVGEEEEEEETDIVGDKQQLGDEIMDENEDDVVIENDVVGGNDEFETIPVGEGIGADDLSEEESIEMVAV